MNEERKIVIVTGVSSGIGNKIAKELILADHIVYGIDMKPCEMEGLKYSQIDVTDEINISGFINAINEKYSGIDYLINAAGIISVEKCHRFCDVPMNEWNRVMDVNLKGTFIMAQKCLPHMNSGGCIVNFSTEQVEKPNLKSVPYAISKSGIEMMNRVIALEAKDKRIRSNVVALASVDTNFIFHMTESAEKFRQKIENANNNMPFGIINVEDVWKIVKFILFDATKMTGQKILVDSGVNLL